MNKNKLALLLLLCIPLFSQGQNKPNILWFVVDDMSANFSCYGEENVKTPHVDGLAEKGLLFTKAYATSPVCSTFRSSLITGMYQTSIGAHHHRSGRGEHRIQLPDGVVPIPELFQKAGYWTCMGSGLPGVDHSGKPTTKKDRLGKSDYNFNWQKSIYNSHDWSGRAPNQPFFMQVQLHGGKIRGASVNGYINTENRMLKEHSYKTDPAHIKLPPYYPDDAIMRRDWATYLDTVKLTDDHVGRVISRLKNEKVFENTIIIFFTDHGISHARGKQFLYDEGTHIPLVISGPGIPQGQSRHDLVESIDIAALSLVAAGIPIPDVMQGKNIIAPNFKPKKAIFAARDRCGEATDRIRSVRTERFLYIKNFYPERPHLMPSNYKDSKLIIKRLRELHSNDQLNELCQRILFSPKRPAEELYLYNQDRWQITNLAELPEYASTLQKHRDLLNSWIIKTNDAGPESRQVYIAETEDQMKSIGNKASRENYRQNSKLYLKWQQEGK